MVRLTNQDGNSYFSSVLLSLIFGVGLVDGSFLRKRDLYNESRSDGVIVAWKADNSSIILIFRYWNYLSWFEAIKRFLVKVMEYIGEKSG